MFWHLGLGVQFLLGLSCSCKQVLPSVCLCVSASIHIPIMCYDKHLKWMFECKLRRLISILSTAFSSVVSTVLFFISVPKRHPVSMFVWHMFGDSLQIFFCILSFWPQDNFPVPNENKQKISWICMGRHSQDPNYPQDNFPVTDESKQKVSWICMGRYPCGSWNSEKKKKKLSEIRVGQPFLVLSSSFVMLFKLTFTVNRQSSLKTESVTNFHIFM